MNFMKYMVIFVSLLLACGPATLLQQPANAPEAEDENEQAAQTISASSEATPVAETNSPLATPVSPLAPPGPIDLSWDPDPTKPLIVATFCCGFAPQLVLKNYINEATIWGDGQMVWVEYADNGSRRVLQAQLNPEQIQTLLREAQARGFFGWDDRYADESIADVPEKCLAINLNSGPKQVCEYFKGAPEAFHQLYAQIVRGAGGAGTDFVPEKVYLQAFKLDGVADAVPVDVEWSADRLGFSLTEAAEGRWLEGDAVGVSWQIANLKWNNMVIREGETYYQIGVQVPGLGLIEPPAR